MKTQIIQLESHDDILSTRDKMGWGKSARILLVWPARGKILDSQLDLLLLKRKSHQLGAQLALVSDNLSVKFFAAQVQIPVFSSIDEAQKANWRSSSLLRYQKTSLLGIARKDVQLLSQQGEELHALPPDWQTSPLFRVLVFFLGVLALLSIAAILVPSAQVFIPLERSSQSVTLQVTASKNVSEVNIAGLLPYREQSVTVSGEEQIQVSGSIQIPATPAQGQVVFTNLSSQPLTLPAGTIVRTLATPPQRYRLLATVQLSSGGEGAQKGTVEALEAGGSGNVSENSIQAVEGELGLKVTVTNPTLIQGGQDQPAPAPSKADQDRLFQALQKKLLDQALLQMNSSEHSQNEILSEQPISTQIEKKLFTPAGFEPSDTLHLELAIIYHFPVISKADIDKLASEALDTNLPENKKPSLDPVVIKNLTKPASVGSGEFTWKINASRILKTKFSEASLDKLLLGKSIPEAALIIQKELGLTTRPTIKLAPSWWPVLPFLPFRIQIVE